MFYQPYKCTLSPEVLQKAIDELHEDPKTRHLEVNTLRERLQQVPGYKGRLDDGFLLSFLRCKKFDQERAFKQVKTFYQVRKDNPHLFDDLTPKRVQNVLDADFFGVLDHRAPNGSRIMYIRAGNWDPDKIQMIEFIRLNVLLFSKLFEEEETQVCGVTVIVDLKGFGWQHAKHYSPSVARLEATIYQDAMPIRFKGIHYLHEPTFIDVVLAVARPFMKEKLMKRIYMHGDKLDKLHEIFPRETLPKELGGTLPPFSYEEWKNKMLSSEEQFVEDNKYGIVDMTIPAKQQQKADATEALGGTFRKLNVD